MGEERSGEDCEAGKDDPDAGVPVDGEDARLPRDQLFGGYIIAAVAEGAVLRVVGAEPPFGGHHPLVEEDDLHGAVLAVYPPAGDACYVPL